MQKFAAWQKLGYRVCVLFIDTELHVCQARVHQREQLTGRPLQANFVTDCNKASRAVASLVKHRADLFVHVTNNSEDPVVLGNGMSELKVFTTCGAPSSIRTFLCQM